MTGCLVGGRSGWWLRVLVLALSLAVFAVSAPVAGAATLSWSAPLALGTGSAFNSITCMTPTECVTGDSDGHELTFDPAGDAIISGPTPAIDSVRSLTIACVPFSTQCTAVDDVGRAVTFNATTGSVIAGPTSIDGTELDAVTCLSTTECVAVDADGARITFNPSNETVTSSHTIDGTNVLYAVVCLSSTECVATDDAKQAVTFNPSSPSVTAGPTPLGTYLNLFGLACPSTTECVAVSGGGYEITFSPTTLVATFPQALVDTYDLETAMHAVSCASTSQCTGVGYGGSEVTFNPTDGSIISAATSIDDSSGSGNSNTLASVACDSVTQCVAVDESGHELTTTTPLSVSVAGSGSGSVTGTGISCPGTCSHGYYPGTTITLTAAAASGSTFGGWSGAGCTGVATCTVSVVSAPTVTATFTANPAPPVVTPPGPNPPIPTSLTVGSVTVSGATALEKLACNTSLTGSCTVSLTLTVTEKVKRGKVIAITASSKAVKTTKRTVVIGRGTLTIAAGHSSTAKVALNAAGRKLVNAHHKLSVLCATTIVGGATLAKHTVTFKQAKKRR
jgi:hypothetical protein